MTFAIFDKLGGQEEALNALKDRSSSTAQTRPEWPTRDTLKKWKSEGELPGSVVKMLMAVCEDRGVPYCLSDFVETQGEAAQ